MLCSFTSSSPAAFMDYCPERFFWGIRFLWYTIPEALWRIRCRVSLICDFVFLFLLTVNLQSKLSPFPKVVVLCTFSGIQTVLVFSVIVLWLLCVRLASVAPPCDAIYAACWTCPNTTQANHPSCRWQYCADGNVRVHSMGVNHGTSPPELD